MDINFSSLNEKCGIYCIKNLVNNKKYIGSSKNLYDRLHQHFHNLKYKKHHSLHLQASYNKYGVENFDFEIIEFCEFDSLYEREQYWIDTICPEYNKRLDAERNSGLSCSEEAKTKISNTLKEKYKNNELTTYKQEHVWIKTYVYDCENYSFLGVFDNIAMAYRFIFNKKENIKVSTQYKDLFRVINKKFILSDYMVSDIKNFCNEIYFKTNSRIAPYLVFEENDKITYCKSVEDCCNKTGASKTTLCRRIKDVYTIYELKSGVKIYYLAQYKPI